MTTPRAAVLLPILLAALAGAGCDDPVHDALVASLGPENPAVPPGPLHRPGQPCLACHDGTGPASMTMIFGGTAYEYYNQTAPLVAAQMSFTDSSMGPPFVTTTNCAGNFWVQATDWTPTFPVDVELFYGGFSPEKMRSHIGRAYSCASCHTGTQSSTTVQQVYYDGDDTMTFPPTGCP
jgi:hypothetical protein